MFSRVIRGGFVKAGDPISWGVSLKVVGKVFAYLTPTRKSFTVSYYDEAGTWADYKVTSAESLEEAKKLAKLRDDGIISQQEFEAKKIDLLSRM